MDQKSNPELSLVVIYEDNGYNDADIAKRFNAVKIVWIGRLINKNYHLWKLIPTKFLGLLGGR